MLRKKQTINNENCQFVSVRGYNIPLFWRSTSPFYFGTGEGSIEHFTRFRPFTRFRFLYRLLPVTSSIISTIVKRLDQPSQQNHDRFVSQKNKIDRLFKFIVAITAFIHFMAAFFSFQVIYSSFYSHK
jgi:hypothetical protein